MITLRKPSLFLCLALLAFPLSSGSQEASQEPSQCSADAELRERYHEDLQRFLRNRGSGSDQELFDSAVSFFVKRGCPGSDPSACCLRFAYFQAAYAHQERALTPPQKGAGVARERLGNLENAILYYRRVLGLSSLDHPTLANLRHAYIDKALLETDLGEREAAAQTYRDARDLYVDHGEPETAAMFWQGEVAAYREVGSSEAIDELLEGLEQFEKSPDQFAGALLTGYEALIGLTYRDRTEVATQALAGWLKARMTCCGLKREDLSALPDGWSPDALTELEGLFAIAPAGDSLTTGLNWWRESAERQDLLAALAQSIGDRAQREERMAESARWWELALELVGPGEPQASELRRKIGIAYGLAQGQGDSVDPLSSAYAAPLFDRKRQPASAEHLLGDTVSTGLTATLSKPFRSISRFLFAMNTPDQLTPDEVEGQLAQVHDHVDLGFHYLSENRVNPDADPEQGAVYHFRRALEVFAQLEGATGYRLPMPTASRLLAEGLSPEGNGEEVAYAFLLAAREALDVDDIEGAAKMLEKSSAHGSETHAAQSLVGLRAVRELRARVLSEEGTSRSELHDSIEVLRTVPLERAFVRRQIFKILADWTASRRDQPVQDVSAIAVEGLRTALREHVILFGNDDAERLGDLLQRTDLGSCRVDRALECTAGIRVERSRPARSAVWAAIAIPTESQLLYLVASDDVLAALEP